MAHHESLFPRKEKPDFGISFHNAMFGEDAFQGSVLFDFVQADVEICRFLGESGDVSGEHEVEFVDDQGWGYGFQPVFVVSDEFFFDGVVSRKLVDDDHVRLLVQQPCKVGRIGLGKVYCLRCSSDSAHACHTLMSFGLIPRNRGQKRMTTEAI